MTDPYRLILRDLAYLHPKVVTGENKLRQILIASRTISDGLDEVDELGGIGS
jgi:hypothetical protein